VLEDQDTAVVVGSYLPTYLPIYITSFLSTRTYRYEPITSFRYSMWNALRDPVSFTLFSRTIYKHHSFELTSIMQLDLFDSQANNSYDDGETSATGFFSRWYLYMMQYSRK
jgi:hypothetical protein